METKPKEISLKLILIYSLLLNAGASCIWPLTTMYIHNYLNESLTISGITLLIMSLFMILGNYLGGYLFDHWSAYKTSLLSISISTIAVILLIFFHGWPTFGILLMPIGLGDGANLTLVNSYATAIKTKSSRYVFNTLYIGLNLGVVIGTAMVGYLLKYGIMILFTVTSLFYIILFILTLFKFRVDFSDYNIVRQQPQLQNKHHYISLIIAICEMVFCIYLSYTLWESVISVYMTNHGISFGKYSFIWTVNGVMVVLGQSLVNKAFKKIHLSIQVALGVFIFGSSFFALIVAHHYIDFIIIMIILTIGEMIGFPNLPAWIDDLAAPSERGQYQAYFNVFMSLGRAVGPLIDGFVVEKFSYPTLFILCGLIVFVSLVWVMFNNSYKDKKVSK